VVVNPKFIGGSKSMTLLQFIAKNHVQRKCIPKLIIDKLHIELEEEGIWTQSMHKKEGKVGGRWESREWKENH
jgi:hypothetical protein